MERAMKDHKNLVIHLVDGTSVAFDFPQQTQESHLLVSQMEKALNQPYVAVESEGVVFFYPRENIKTMQVYPAPEKLPDFVIRGAEFVHF